MKKLIIYDLDGTLVDTREDIVRSANYMVSQLDKPELPSDEVCRYVGRGLHHLVRNCLKTEDRKLVEKGAKIYREYYAAHMMDHSRLYCGVLELLNHFKHKKQAVITNKPSPFSEDMLKSLKVADYFLDIITGDSDYPRKPDPAAVRAIMEREKALPAETVFVGDSVVDIETGKNAGVDTAVVTHGFNTADQLQSASPTVLVSGFEELLAVAKREKW